jgi:hypothetical protein
MIELMSLVDDPDQLLQVELEVRPEGGRFLPTTPHGVLAQSVL